MKSHILLMMLVCTSLCRSNEIWVPYIGCDTLPDYTAIRCWNTTILADRSGKCILRNGKMVYNGDTKVFWNGKLSYTGRYVNGKHDGEWLRYDSTGSIAGRMFYHHGKVLKSIDYDPYGAKRINYYRFGNNYRTEKIDYDSSKTITKYLFGHEIDEILLNSQGKRINSPWKTGANDLHPIFLPIYTVSLSYPYLISAAGPVCSIKLPIPLNRIEKWDWPFLVLMPELGINGGGLRMGFGPGCELGYVTLNASIMRSWTIYNFSTFPDFPEKKWYAGVDLDMTSFVQLRAGAFREIGPDKEHSWKFTCNIGICPIWIRDFRRLGGVMG